MKKYLLAALVIVCGIVVPACQKGIWGPNTLLGLYSSWPAQDSIEMHFVGLGGVASRDGMYAVGSGGYIDFSTKGIIVFHIKGWEHTDIYDATRYNLLKDITPVNEGGPTVQHVSISVTGKSSFVLTEVADNTELHSTTIYKLHK